MPADTSVTVAGLALKNPVIAGSGEATATRDGIAAAIEAGAAAVVAKSANESVSARRQLESAAYVLLDPAWGELPWGPAPRGATLFNRSGLVGEAFDRWVAILSETDRLAAERDAYVVPSLIVADPVEAVGMVETIEASGLRWLELNVGAPHAEEAAAGSIRAAAGPAQVAELVAPIRRATRLPLTVKLGCEGNRVAAAAAAFNAGADAVCMAGRHVGFLPDPATRRPVLGTFGAVGGGWALPLTLRWVAKARAALGAERSLVGTNGARDGLDVVRFLLAGASAVQMTTVVITDGPAALTGAVEAVGTYLSEQGTSARDIIGEAADHVMTYEEAGTA